MNFGVTSVAAPNAASSRTARYSSTRAAGCVRWQARGALDTRAVAGLGRDQAGVDGKPFTADQALLDAPLQHGFEQPAQQIDVAETAMPVLRKGRMIGYLTV